MLFDPRTRDMSVWNVSFLGAEGWGGRREGVHMEAKLATGSWLSDNTREQRL